ncbi:hypothetical protein GCM10010495_75450 [Kitasatospora herbaricolor]|uniref:hypothetical protein n=1 Tax=Kitasatospora herbaricolor TaxID=68217 RepID=UPI0017482A51|nr:hypothetical protein [Kitasatospora herbaricolor]MDQ0306682.1 hypothetical protein [Kitasatospora herbaricolor]GGV46721.1 hypothetical protein GCM10010495_75450 [Kitasatospora herbaricolor]
MMLYRARPGRRTFRPVVGRLPAGMSGTVAFGAFAALVAALAVVGELHATWFALGAFAALCALLGAVSRPVAAPLVAGTGWLFFNGFVVHRHATLEWGGAGVEGARLGLFTAAALVLSLPAALPRRKVRVRLLPAPDHPRSAGD